MDIELSRLKIEYENGRLTWAGAIDAVKATGRTVFEAEEIVAEWDAGVWAY